MNLTLDQLAYILERKYKNIQFGKDVIITCTVKEDSVENNADATISFWNIDYITKPSEKDIETYWNILKEQYHSDETRIDSDMYKFINSKKEEIKIEINEDIK